MLSIYQVRDRVSGAPKLADLKGKHNATALLMSYEKIKTTKTTSTKRLILTI